MTPWMLRDEAGVEPLLDKAAIGINPGGDDSAGNPSRGTRLVMAGAGTDSQTDAVA
jgi:hypothetical protein